MILVDESIKDADQEVLFGIRNIATLLLASLDRVNLHACDYLRHNTSDITLYLFFVKHL